MIKNISVFVKSCGKACDLIPHGKGFILTDSDSGEEIIIDSLQEIESVMIEDDECNRLELETFCEEK